MLTTKKRQVDPYNAPLTNEESTPPPTATRVSSTVKNNKVEQTLQRRIWKQLLSYLNGYEVNSSARSQLALLQEIRRPDTRGYFQRENVLGSRVQAKHKEKAHKLLIEASNQLIADISKGWGGAA